MKENQIETKIIASTIMVHRKLEPDLLESIYEILLKNGITRIVNNL